MCATLAVNVRRLTQVGNQAPLPGVPASLTPLTCAYGGSTMSKPSLLFSAAHVTVTRDEIVKTIERTTCGYVTIDATFVKIAEDIVQMLREREAYLQQRKSAP